MNNSVIAIIIFSMPVFLIVAFAIAEITKCEVEQKLALVKAAEFQHRWEIIRLKNELDTEKTRANSILLTVKKFGCPTCANYRDGEMRYPCCCCKNHEKWRFTWTPSK